MRIEKQETLVTDTCQCRKKRCLALILVPLLTAVVAIAVIVPSVLLTQPKAKTSTAIYLSNPSTLFSTMDDSSTIIATVATIHSTITTTEATTSIARTTSTTTRPMTGETLSIEEFSFRHTLYALVTRIGTSYDVFFDDTIGASEQRTESD